MIEYILKEEWEISCFQYAFALHTAKKLNTSFFMDESVKRFVINEYFELGSYHFMKSKWNRFLFGRNKPVWN